MLKYKLSKRKLYEDWKLEVINKEVIDSLISDIFILESKDVKIKYTNEKTYRNKKEYSDL